MAHETPNEKKSAAGGRAASAVERLVKRPVAWLWEQFKMPVTLFLITWIMGFGFYHGVMFAVDFGEMSLGRALIISVVDVPSVENAGDQ